MRTTLLRHLNRAAILTLGLAFFSYPAIAERYLFESAGTKAYCHIELLAYAEPLPYKDRQLVPVVINKRFNSGACPSPEVKTGQLLYLDTTNRWSAGIGMRVYTSIWRDQQAGNPNTTPEHHRYLILGDVRDAQNHPLNPSHPLIIERPTIYFP